MIEPLASHDWDVRVVVQCGPLPSRYGQEDVDGITRRVALFDVETVYVQNEHRLEFTSELVGMDYPRVSKWVDDLLYRVGTSPRRVIELGIKAREETT